MKRIIQIALLASIWVGQCHANVVSHDRKRDTVNVDQYGTKHDGRKTFQPKDRPTKKDIEKIVTDR